VVLARAVKGRGFAEVEDKNGWCEGVSRGDGPARHRGPRRPTVLTDLAAAGFDYDNVVRLFEREGIRKFAEAWT
jgi:hypothetical protein